MTGTLIKRVLVITLTFCVFFAVVGCGETQPDSSHVSTPTDSNISSDSVAEKDTYEKDGVIYVGDDTKVSFETTVKNFGDYSSESDEDAAKLRKEILEAKDAIKAKGTTYYVSNSGDDENDGTSSDKPWKTLNALTTNEYKIKEGDAILFNRGDIFRGTFKTLSGVSYGAYGKGDKPAIYGCKSNYAKETWRRTSEENIYALIYTSSADVGMIVFNHGEAYGNKKLKNAFECDEDYEFYHDKDGGMVYLYCSKGKPSDVFYDIELLYDRHIINIPNNSENVYIENLCLKYTGAHGISVGMPVKSITIKNCEIGWIGGSIHRTTGNVRYGNGIQFYGQTTDALVDHCWVYQCYDAALTHQYGGASNGNPEMNATNISYTNNLVEFSTYSLEYFWGWKEDGKCVENPNVYMKDILVENNVMRFAGYGMGLTRPDPGNTAHITTWNTSYNTSKNFVIKNNIFDTSSVNLINARTFSSVNPIYSGNKFIQKEGGKLGHVYINNKSDQPLLPLDETSLKTFDKNGTLIIKK